MTAELESIAYPRGDGFLIDWQDYADVIADLPPEEFLARIEAAAGDNDIWLVAGLGYKSLGNRCEVVIDTLNRTRRADQLVAPTEVFERMLLTRYEPIR
jgi:hypothetical protein